MKIKKNDINLKSTLLSGQCFRAFEEKDSSFTVVLEDRVINIKESKDYLIVESNKNEDLKKIIENYFDLNRNYNEINNVILKNNHNLFDVIEYSKGYKILNQPDFETIISYIISQNNSVHNISLSIEKLSKKYGKKVLFRNKEYYLFPTFDELSNLSLEDFRVCGVGFRDKYISNFIEILKNDKDFIKMLYNVSTTDALAKLLEVKGIGLKVASCILLFGFSRFDVFPIDTWVKKYFNCDNINDIKEKSLERFSNYSGLAIQYIFHYQRNKNKL